MKRTVLVTGLNGVIGRAIRQILEEKYIVSALSRSGVDHLPSHRVHKADIANFQAIRPAFEGMDTVIHLAADGGESSPHADMNVPWESILPNNIIGTYNVFEAARQAGVRRVIFASSGATIIGYEEHDPYRQLVNDAESLPPGPWPMITHESEPKPRSLYGLSKLVGEDLARYFVGISPMSIICLRIGQVRDSNVPQPGRDQSVWCSQQDMAHMIQKCLEAPDSLRFDIFYVTSQNRRGYRDLSHAKDVLGYSPTEGI